LNILLLQVVVAAAFLPAAEAQVAAAQGAT
jgi:hypothetical protein